jgi:benzoyl-CoA-dihydrodiol lyase
VPLLGVLPGTGGLTRLTDKRNVRHDHADVLCTTTEGVRGRRALEWRLVDALAKPGDFDRIVRERAMAHAEGDNHAQVAGIALAPLQREDSHDGLRYRHVHVDIDRTRRIATFTVFAPQAPQPADVASIERAGAAWWPLAMGRELDDAILWMRTNALDAGTWLLATRGDSAAVLACDAVLARHRDHWLVRETIGLLRRTLARLDVSSRTLFALIEPDSCVAGTLAELAFAADRSYMLALPDEPGRAPGLTLSEANFGFFPMVTGRSRLDRRFHGEAAPLEAAREAIGVRLDAGQALALGLVTFTPDDIDWADEVRIALEERSSMSPDALTGMEANLRFGGAETMHSRVFGRLTAWQNWIFIRPNAVGEKGALKVYGTGEKAQFDFRRV